MIAVNPVEFVKGQKLSTISQTVYLTRTQARQLLDHCAGLTLRDARDRMLLTVMLRTGVRSSEALGLTVDDLATVDGHQVAWVTGKGGARGSCCRATWPASSGSIWPTRPRPAARCFRACGRLARASPPTARSAGTA